jgi:hypothetical protein
MTADILTRARLDGAMTEADWQDQVIDYAHLKGWRVAHFRPARTAHGWRTPVTADGAGFPDLVCVRERVVIAELKSEKGKITAEQARWIGALVKARAEVYVWRPSDWPQVERVLA